MKKALLITSAAALLSLSAAETATLTLQNGESGYTGCEDRSLFERKSRDYEGNWGGTMAGTYPDMKYHNIEANDGECIKLALGQLIC